MRIPGLIHQMELALACNVRVVIYPLAIPHPPVVTGQHVPMLVIPTKQSSQRLFMSPLVHVSPLYEF